MATINFFTVRFHYETNGKKAAQYGEQRQEHVAAATGDAATIAAVLAANCKGAPAGTVLVIDSIANAGPGSALS